MSNIRNYSTFPKFLDPNPKLTPKGGPLFLFHLAHINVSTSGSQGVIQGAVAQHRYREAELAFRPSAYSLLRMRRTGQSVID